MPAAPAPAASRPRRAVATESAKAVRMKKAEMRDEERELAMDDMVAAAPMEELASMAGMGVSGGVEAQIRFELPKDAGVLPVRMDVPEKGLRFQFEKLLVLDEPLFLETEYAKEKRAS